MLVDFFYSIFNRQSFFEPEMGVQYSINLNGYFSVFGRSTHCLNYAHAHTQA